MSLCKEKSSAKKSNKNCSSGQHNCCWHTWGWELEHPIVKYFLYSWPPGFRESERHIEKSVCYFSPPPFHTFFFFFNNTMAWTPPWIRLHHLQGGLTLCELQDPSVLRPGQEMGRGRGWGAAGQWGRLEGRFSHWGLLNSWCSHALAELVAVCVLEALGSCCSEEWITERE